MFMLSVECTDALIRSFLALQFLFLLSLAGVSVNTADCYGYRLPAVC